MAVRIPETMIHGAIQELSIAGRESCVADFPGVGIFSLPGLRRMRFLADICSISSDVVAEKVWFEQFSWESTECIKELLWDFPCQTRLGLIGGVPVTPHLLSTLTCERCLTDDAVFVAACAALPPATSLLVLPALTLACEPWQQTLSETCRQAVQRFDGAEVRFLAQIMHLPGHWTVAIVDRCSGQMYFANSLERSYATPQELLKKVVKTFRVVEAYLPDVCGVCFRDGFQLLSVPQQSMNAGPASCGVGVAMILRDIAVQDKIPEKWTWSFQDSPRIRLGLLQKLAYSLTR